MKILLAGSSHTRLFFPYVKRFLMNRASVAVLPEDAGRTDEILGSLPEWPVEEQDIIHLYAGHRDLMQGPDGEPCIGPEEFKRNLRGIVRKIRDRTSAKIVLSNIPFVSEEFLTVDPQWNDRIALYNRIIGEVAGDTGIPVHDFQAFISSLRGNGAIYTDGLHFTEKVYRDFGEALALYLIGEAT